MQSFAVKMPPAVSKKVTAKAPQSIVHQLIDLLDKPDIMKWELPSKQLRENSLNLQADNKSKNQRLVTLGYKITDEPISTLCPGPSKYRLFNDVYVMLGNVWIRM